MDTSIKTEGNAIIYCEGAFETPFGKTAHGLIRFTARYNVLCVIDSSCAGQDSGLILDRKKNGIPVVASLEEAIDYSNKNNQSPSYFVIGIATDGGVFTDDMLTAVKDAITAGLNIDSGLHDFLCEMPDMVKLAEEHNVKLRDVRKTALETRHFFSGNIEKVKAFKIAVLGTDSSVGKRTTAQLIVKGFNNAGMRSVMIGTGQTAWMQGAKYYSILDSTINDFVAGGIENAVYSAWKDLKPEVIVVEGQGSLMNPAYPGGFEILAAARPDVIVLQHAPARKEYDGFPGYPLHPLKKQIKALELLSGKKVVAITINHELLSDKKLNKKINMIRKKTELFTTDVLLDGTDELIKELKKYYENC